MTQLALNIALKHSGMERQRENKPASKQDKATLGVIERMRIKCFAYYKNVLYKWDPY